VEGMQAYLDAFQGSMCSKVWIKVRGLIRACPEISCCGKSNAGSLQRWQQADPGVVTIGHALIQLHNCCSLIVEDLSDPWSSKRSCYEVGSNLNCNQPKQLSMHFYEM